MCLNSQIISLNPFPAGGTFSGNGIAGNIFFAFAAGIGNDTITYQYTDSNGCTNSYSQNVLIDACLGINDFENLNSLVQIFPNPTLGKFTIQSPSEKIAQISITNLSGQIIYKKELSGFLSGIKDYEIDLTSHSKGVYLIQIVTGKKVCNQKIVLD